MAKRALKAGPSLEEETLFWNFQDGVFLFGVDEAGRGCLAGPVCAAVACFEPCAEPPVPVRDSKQMKESEREACFEPVKARAKAFGVGYGSSLEIDRWNILKANYLALARALEAALRPLGEAVFQGKVVFLTDGNHPLVRNTEFFVRMAEYRAEFSLLSRLFEVGFEEKCIVKGDSKVFSIAAASVLAKVSRDRLMHELDAKYPAYEFALHKGYSTPRHMELLRKVGPCAEHRKSFAPVSESLTLFR